MWKYPLYDLSFGKKEIESVESVMKSGWVSMGEITQKFEHKFAEFLNVKHAIALSNCTAALHLALLSLDIGEHDEVICPSLTFVAGANAIGYCGASPVFADIESLQDLCISPDDIEKNITDKTKAIQVMHYAGYPCNMDKILQIAQQHNLAVIEDCAHAPGAEYRGKKCGTIGDVGCFSFFSNKNLTTGEGGMITTNDDILAEKIRLMRSHGMTSLSWDRVKGHSFSYDVTERGFNYRIDEMRSAIGIVQLEKLNLNNKKRETLVNAYKTILSKNDNVLIPFIQNPEVSSYHIFPILLSEDICRNQFMEYLKKQGVQTSIHYPPIHLFEYYYNTVRALCHLPVTENVAKREVTLPLYPGMKLESVEYVCRMIYQFFQES